MARKPTSYRGNKRAAAAEKSPDELVIQEAKDRFKRAEDWESPFWRLYTEDIKFGLGDSDNGWQWPDDLRRERETNKRPTLTVNKVGPMCRLITNDQRQNKSAIMVRPANGQASFEAAEVYEGIVRQIEYASNAQAIYDDAGESQVEGGIGFWRVDTQYVDNDPGPDAGAAAFDQECAINPVPAHRNVYLDCDIKKKDGSDAEWGFIFDDVPDEEIERLHPGADVASDGLTGQDSWTRDGYVRIAEYFRIVKTQDQFIWVEDEQGNSSSMYASDMPEGYAGQVAAIEKEDPERVKRRKIEKRQLEWYKIIGDKIVARRKLKGRYIPIVRCVGIERVVDGKLERKGHIRALKDQQRMYNYNSSGQVEFGALQTKTSWIVAAAAVMGNEVAWQNANRSNAAYLTYRHKDADDVPLPAPQRNDPPGTSPAFVTGMEIADRELAMASGQYNAQQGKDGNEISGKAIGKRQRQSDTATFHFTDNMSGSIRHTGVIVLDLIAQVYTTERIQKILGKDGKQTQVKIDPAAEQAYQKTDEEKDDVAVIFNPNVGKYEVVSDPGPSYATKRQEAWDAFVQIVIGSPELINDIGDFMFQNADFPMADKIAERLRAKIRKTQPWLLDDEAPGPFVQQLQGELQSATQQIGELLEKLADTKRTLKSKDQRRDIEAYRAEGDRFNKMGNTVKDVEGFPEMQQMLLRAMEQVIQNLYGEDISLNIDQQQDAAEGKNQSDDEQPPIEGAKKAKDGQWYVPNPGRPGKFLRVATEAAAA